MKVGPGSYYVDELSKKKLPKGVNIKDWSRDQTARFQRIAPSQSLEHVGPGQYQLDKVPFT